MIKPKYKQYWYNIENLFSDEKCKHNRPLTLGTYVKPII